MLRRVLLYATISERLRPYLEAPNVFVVRYERWFEDSAALQRDIGDFLEVELPACPVRLREPGEPAALTSAEKEMIRTHARVAEAFGYDVGEVR